MNLEKVIDLILSDSNINVQYSNINGDEKLIVNGEEISEKETPENFDDTETLKRVKRHEEFLNELDDDIFDEGLEVIRKKYDLITIDSLLEKGSYSETEAEVINSFIDFAESLYKDIIKNKINNLKNLLDRF